MTLRDSSIVRHIPFFVTVAEERHFRRAAERLNVSQPALSRRMRRLEKELGVLLFDRKAGGIQLTVAGRLLLERFRLILGGVEEAISLSRAAALGETGVLRVAFNESAAAHGDIVGSSIRAFRGKYPEINIVARSMDSSTQMGALREGEIDAGFMFSLDRKSADLTQIEFAVQDFALAMPSDHALLRRHRIRLSQLGDERFIWNARSQSPYVYDRMIAACRAGGLTPRIVMEVNSTQTMINMIAAGLGIGFVRQVYETPPSVVLRAVADFSVPLHLALVWKKSAGSVVLDRFVSLVRTTAGRRKVPPFRPR